MEQLLELVPHPQPARAVVISAIDGMAGIGKTVLAVRAAHRMVNEFPDGQLFIDLHGYTPGIEPIQPAEALDRLLQDLGIPGTQIPDSLDQRGALYRTQLADRRMLIVLDNAATEDQVAPLLPGTPGCRVLITSRRRLAGLDHIDTLSLDILPMPDAVKLLIQTAGQGQPADEPPDLMAELVELCGRLPLAIQIAAARLRSHSAWRLADLVERLRDRQHRLGELEAGQRSVTAALDLSYQDLGPDQQQAYRLLGLHPGPRFGVCVAAALFDCTLPPARRMLDQLFEANLLQEPASGRYMFHDLVRDHAARAAQTDPESDRRAALGRLVVWYVAAVEAIMRLWWTDDRATAVPMPDGLELTSATDGRLWLILEQENLVALSTVADVATQSTWVNLAWHLIQLDLYDAARDLFRNGAKSSSDTGDRHIEAQARRGLAEIARLTGRFAEAKRLYRHALHLSRSVDDQPGKADAQRGLADIALATNRPHAARTHGRKALKISRNQRDRLREANALRRLGDVACVMGELDVADKHLCRALAIYQELPDLRGQANALRALGDVAHRAGRFTLAREFLRSALTIYERLGGDKRGVASAKNSLGTVASSKGEHEEARELWRDSLMIYDRLGSPIARTIESALTDLAHPHEASAATAKLRRVKVPRGTRPGRYHRQ